MIVLKTNNLLVVGNVEGITVGLVVGTKCKVSSVNGIKYQECKYFISFMNPKIGVMAKYI
jgi:hypothetical protein